MEEEAELLEIQDVDGASLLPSKDAPRLSWSPPGREVASAGHSSSMEPPGGLRSCCGHKGMGVLTGGHPLN